MPGFLEKVILIPRPKDKQEFVGGGVVVELQRWMHSRENSRWEGPTTGRRQPHPRNESSARWLGLCRSEMGLKRRLGGRKRRRQWKSS